MDRHYLKWVVTYLDKNKELGRDNYVWSCNNRDLVTVMKDNDSVFRHWKIFLTDTKQLEVTIYKLHESEIKDVNTQYYINKELSDRVRTNFIENILT